MEGVASRAKYECLLFDMDDTLYPWSLGLNLACRKNIQDYMLHHLQIEESDVPRMCLELYKEYGTTMAGLKALGFEFDNDEFHAYVHGQLPYEKLKPDPVLKNLLLSMPQRKIIFTNADKAHAAQVLSRLGLEDCFEGVICFETLNPPLAPTDDDEKMDTCNHTADTSNDSIAHGFYSEGESEGVAVHKAPALEGESESDTNSDDKSKTRSKLRIICKPSIEAMEAAIKIANIDPKKTIFFDDSTRNIAAAKAVGLRTVIVGSSVLVPGADLALGSIHNIKEALPEIWADGEQSDPVLQSTTVEILA